MGRREIVGVREGGVGIGGHSGAATTKMKSRRQKQVEVEKLALWRGGGIWCTGRA